MWTTTATAKLKSITRQRRQRAAAAAFTSNRSIKVQNRIKVRNCRRKNEIVLHRRRLQRHLQMKSDKVQVHMRVFLHWDAFSAVNVDFKCLFLPPY